LITWAEMKDAKQPKEQTLDSGASRVTGFDA
jgi:hypothetical protein